MSLSARAETAGMVPPNELVCSNITIVSSDTLQLEVATLKVQLESLAQVCVYYMLLSLCHTPSYMPRLYIMPHPFLYATPLHYATPLPICHAFTLCHTPSYMPRLYIMPHPFLYATPLHYATPLPVCHAFTLYHTPSCMPRLYIMPHPFLYATHLGASHGSGED